MELGMEVGNGLARPGKPCHIGDMLAATDSK